MATRAQQAQLLSDATFQQQVTGSLIAMANNVINEAGTTAGHANRLAWANAILANPHGQMLFLLPGMLTNPVVSGAAGGPATESGTPVLDGDCDFVVSSLYTLYANQFAAQTNVGASLQFGH